MVLNSVLLDILHFISNSYVHIPSVFNNFVMLPLIVLNLENASGDLLISVWHVACFGPRRSKATFIQFLRARVETVALRKLMGLLKPLGGGLAGQGLKIMFKLPPDQITPRKEDPPVFRHKHRL